MRKSSGKPINSSQKEKLEVVLEVLENGRKRKEVAEEKDVSLNSIAIWIKNFRMYGKEGLSFDKRTAFVPQEETLKELKRLKKIGKRYNEQLEGIGILKKFQSFLRERMSKRYEAVSLFRKDHPAEGFFIASSKWDQKDC